MLLLYSVAAMRGFDSVTRFTMRGLINLGVLFSLLVSLNSLLVANTQGVEKIQTSENVAIASSLLRFRTDALISFDYAHKRAPALKRNSTKPWSSLFKAVSPANFNGFLVATLCVCDAGAKPGVSCLTAFSRPRGRAPPRAS
jgi:hypothetical protein